MPKLTDIYKTIDVKIPNSDIVITIKDTLPWYDQMELIKFKDEIELAKFLIHKMIVDWNLYDDDNKKIAITKEVCDTFGADIVFSLYKEIQKLIDIKSEKKKTWLNKLSSLLRV